MKFVVRAPLEVQISKNKKFILNLNHYRNAHYQVLNKAKHLFKEEISEQLTNIGILNSCRIEYFLYTKTKRVCDVSNVCSVVDKFFCDAFVELGHLPDDNYKYLNTVTYRFGGVDFENPRVEIVIWKIS